MKIDRRISPMPQRGQATGEMVVLGFVNVPLILAMPLLGKYRDIAQAAAIASRYPVRSSILELKWRKNEATPVHRWEHGGNDLWTVEHVAHGLGG